MKRADGEPAPEPVVALLGLTLEPEEPALLEGPVLPTPELGQRQPGQQPDQRRGQQLGRGPEQKPEPGPLTEAVWAAAAVRVGPRRWVTQP